MNTIRKSHTLQEVELFLTHLYTQMGDVKVNAPCPDLQVDIFHFQDIHGLYIKTWGQDTICAFIVAMDAGITIFTGDKSDFDKISTLAKDWVKSANIYRWDWERDNYTAGATHLINFFAANQEQ